MFSGTGFLHPLPLVRSDFSFWVMLYNIDRCHFQLAALKYKWCDSLPVAAFLPGDVPLGLVEAFNAAHRTCRHF